MLSRSTLKSAAGSLLIGGASVAGGLVLWAVIASLPDVPDYILPPPDKVFSSAVNLWQLGALQPHIIQTLKEVLLGGAIGTVLGVLLGSIFHYVPAMRSVFMPVIVVAQVTPKISIAPLIVLWLGLGLPSKLALVILVSFYPVLINLVSRLGSLPIAYKDLAHILGMKPLRRAFRIDFPFTFPALAAGMKLGLLQGVTASVIGQFIGSTSGLGFLELQGQQNADVSLVLTSIGLLAAIGYALFATVTGIERYLGRRYS